MQDGHSKKYTQALAGIAAKVSAPQWGQYRMDCRVGSAMPYDKALA